MKGGFYGLKGKQITFGLLALVCTLVLIWAWDNNPRLSFLLPLQNHSMQLFPVVNEEVVDKVEQQNSDVKSSKASAENSSRNVKDKHSDASASKEVLKSSTSKEKESLRHTPAKVDPDLVSNGKNRSKVSETDLVASQNSKTGDSSVRENKKKSATNMSSGACNYAKGKWVEDDARPLYSGLGCKQWLSKMWACRLTQRTDFAYERLRWQPKDCAMEEFTGPKFLERMRNKTVAFVGDSLGRQQFQSLMCMATGGEERPDVSDVAKEYGLAKKRGAIRPDGWVYRFPTTNTTILYYWSASLSELEPLDKTNPKLTEFAMHLDRPPSFLKDYIHRFDILVLNTGHHWNRGKFAGNRWVMHVGGKPNMDSKIADINGAKNLTVHSIVSWVNSQLPKHPGLKAFYRTISPRHFFNGDWNTGGTCDNTALTGQKEVLQDESSDTIAASAVKGTKVKLLDITAVSQLRDEGHISKYTVRPTPGMQDCLHWCMPGVPDSWNEILFAQI